ncbi:cell division protein FtsQ/DivIB [Histidinibacterium aquaticum]|uniref:Cell division protein FtsQ n=1 Tax=Histidinibacterium aquaticum TaxID=2613962 RepID=A0A5J5GI69_9RHOB|nr:cell division protein FtsQ/DivIB [Histidinibacterium aquaticum]KAA9007926.1 FtsQ-type POTRA domain-containing protein [Histidinibacterium aquaticum]
MRGSEPRRSRDPAPSRLHYRLNRLMLTPAFRRFLRLGVPLVVVGGIAAFWFGQEQNRAALVETAGELRDRFEARPEFRVNGMEVTGADEALTEEVRAVLPVEFPVSSFDLDLEEMRQLVAALNRVDRARVRVRPGGILEVALTEREPAAVWRGTDGLKLVDSEGVFVAPLAARGDRADLPLVAGEGAPEALPEAMALFEAAAPLGNRIRGLVRQGERRWDVVLEDNQRVLLPAEAPVRALERVLALDSAQDLFERDIAVVDMRNQERPTIRLRPAAAAAFRARADRALEDQE